MGLRINTNIVALNSHRVLTANDNALGKSLVRLSSGLRINSAADDAAGLAIAEKFRAQVNGLSMAMQNSQDAINLLQTAEGALNETEAILQRMRELSVQAANDTMVASDRTAIKGELDQLSAEIDGIATRTQYNTKALLSGSFATAAMTFQIGSNNGQTISLTIGDMSADGLTAQTSDISVSSHTFAAAAITALDSSIQLVSAQRAKLGAVINRLDHTINNLGVQRENMASSESRIRDLDMAAEVSVMTRNQILTQSSQAMLAQANQVPQGVLSLLRN
ncbi:MAG: flagellin [Candidatus Sericytochromatia bacterium]|nr:flagellin [Candidatus Tanganyikabacteria bacterium]